MPSFQVPIDDAEAAGAAATTLSETGLPKPSMKMEVVISARSKAQPQVQETDGGTNSKKQVGRTRALPIPADESTSHSFSRGASIKRKKLPPNTRNESGIEVRMLDIFVAVAF